MAQPWYGDIPEEAPAKFSGRTVSVFVVWIVAEYLYIVGRLPEMTLSEMGFLLFYTTLTPAVFLTALTISYLREDYDPSVKQTFIKLFKFDPERAVWSFIIVGGMSFFVFFGLFSFLGYEMKELTGTDITALMNQIFIVVPNETFVFIVFLPVILPRIWKIPPWLYAQFLFGMFHYVAFGFLEGNVGPGAIAALMMAMLFGVIWWNFYSLGDEVSFMGLGAVLSNHFTWNMIVMVMVTTGSFSVFMSIARIFVGG